MTEPKTVDEIVGAIDEAHKELCAATKRQWDGRTALKISIQGATHDSDLIIGTALREAKQAITALAAERDQAVEENAQRLLDYRRWRDELLKERDALKARVQGAVRLYPTPIPEGFYPDGSRNKGGNAKVKLARILKRLKAKRGKGK